MEIKILYGGCGLLLGILIIISFRYFSNNKNDQIMVDPVIFNYHPPIEGSCKIKGDSLQVVVEVPVESKDFIYSGQHYALNLDGYKAVVFRYHDDENPKNEDDGPATESIRVQFNIKNTFGWKVGDQIRIMCLNENEKDEFSLLKPYFEERLKRFKYELYETEVYTQFNTEWNNKLENEHRRVKPVITEKREEQPRRTKDDGILVLR